MSDTHRYGVVASYIHPNSQIGALIEISCESAMGARTRELHDLAHDLAVQVAACSPQFIREEDIADCACDEASASVLTKVTVEGRPQRTAARLIAARMATLHRDLCLLEQRFVKDQSITIRELIQSKSNALKERISVARFVRFRIGEPLGVDAS